jgi:hypothetical protein
MKLANQKLSKAIRPLLLACVIVFIGCRPNDSIQSLVKRLSSDPYWYNGYENPINLPSTMSQSNLVLEAFNHAAISNVKPISMHISGQREVSIKGHKYSALLVETDVGEKIVLLRYVEKAHCWLSYVFDVKA